MVGKTDFDFFSNEHARPAFEDEQQIIRTGQPIIGKIEHVIWKASQHDSWMLTTKMPFRSKTGEIIGTFGISKDITPIKEAEARLEAAHRQLLETSRLAGMAEVATSVLHNVGNVLNSVNVSTTLALELVKKSRLHNLGRVAALINENRNNLANFLTIDPKGSQLPAYLASLTEHLATEHAQLTAEIELTRKNIEHIKDIVTMQQSYAKVSGVVENVKVTDLVEDALRMNNGALTRHNVELIRNFSQSAFECHTERQKVLQILINLIRNAKYACDESGRPDKHIIMQVLGVDGRVQIIVTDNGVGIPAENLTRIFNHGFTTREHGHGFGLHSGALAAKELGGSLTAHSDGPGTGARFVLELPLQQPHHL
jgi:C4-dicarboxylate-specific signal transduction histidine kinase